MQIQDLSKELDVGAMTAVRGGDNANSVANTIGQQLTISSPIAVMSSGPANTSVNVTGKQTANVVNGLVAGDLFSIFPFFA